MSWVDEVKALDALRFAIILRAMEAEKGGGGSQGVFCKRKLSGSMMSCDHKAVRTKKGISRRGAMKELIHLTTYLPPSFRSLPSCRET